MRQPRLLQICNVGSVVGGTGACTWSVVQSLPGFAHSIRVLGTVQPEFRKACAVADVESITEVTDKLLLDTKPDGILLHNVARERVAIRSKVPALYYVHSPGRPVTKMKRVYCSRYLAERCGDPNGEVLYQGVPRPLGRELSERRPGQELVVGRLCSARADKWPRAVLPFYQKLAQRFPQITWEFVGCPVGLQADLLKSCEGRAKFFAAHWQARQRLWHWDVLLYSHPNLPETFGRIVAEAMRAGCVPVVDDQGGFREQITAETGFLCRDDAAFGDAVMSLQSVEHRQNMSRAAQHWADEQFGLKGFGERLCKPLWCDIAVV